MEEFVHGWLGEMAKPVCGAIGILTATVLTQLVKLLANAKAWGPLANPLIGRDTDRLMPAVALLVGLVYGWITGRAPGLLDNISAGLTYGAGSIAAYMLVKKTLLGQ